MFSVQSGEGFLGGGDVIPSFELRLFASKCHTAPPVPSSPSTPTLSLLLSSLAEKGIQNTLLIFARWRENLGGIRECQYH